MHNSNDCWIATKEHAEIKGTSERAVCKANGKRKTEKTKSVGLSPSIVREIKEKF
ncbi:MAG: hypothetical protein NC200_07675 [Candidatus Gastranaerophilales bacterium]|nr:hypothetical protein [Candidatus Gastranaerophilales bacterium]